jgi:MFS family permease
MSSHQSHRIRTLWLTGVLHAFTHLYQVALLPLYFEIQQDFRLSTIDKSTLLLTVMFVAYFLPSYPMGILADKLSRKKLLAAGLAINGLGFLMLSLSHTYVLAVMSMIVAGLGGSFYHPAATALIARLFPEARGRALGWVGVGASLGFFIGPLYTGWRCLAAGSWRVPICELGVLGMIAALAFFWLADDEKTLEQIDLRHELLKKESAATPLFPTAALWMLFLGAAFLLSLRDFTGSAMGTSASLYLQNAFQFTSGSAGRTLSVMYAASAISNPLFGRLSDRGRMRWAATLLLAAAVLVMVFSRVPVSRKGATLLVFGFFFMASYPITEAALMEAVPDAVRGRVFGLFITIGGLVGNLSHWVVGAWVGKLGSSAALPSSYHSLYTTLAVLVLLSICGLPCLKAIRRREHIEPASSRQAIPLAPLATP